MVFWMASRSRSLLVAGMVVSLLAVGAVGQKEGLGYVRFSYRTETAEGNHEIVTTEIVPMPDGQYRVVTTTEQTTSPEEMRIAVVGGGSYRWLGLRTSEETGARFDLASVDVLADQGLEPNRRYLLPDGGRLQTKEWVTVAGIQGIEAVYTHSSSPGVMIVVVVAADPGLRQLLPFPLRVQVSEDDMHEDGAAETDEDDGDEIRGTGWLGTIELVEFSQTQERADP